MGAEPGTPTADTGGRGIRVLRTLAYFTIVVAGLKAASSLVVPFLLAAFIAMICVPAIRRLKRWGVPGGLAIAAVMLLILLVLVAFSGVVSGSVARFSASVDDYEAKLRELFAQVSSGLERIGVDLSKEQIEDAVDSGALLRFISRTTGSLFGVLSDLVVLLLIIVFMLLEAAGLPDKLRRAMGKPDDDLAGFQQVSEQVYEYIWLKTLVSLGTGVTVGLMTWAFGVDFPVLWGVLAFLFNYIPNIGSLIAAIPAVILALVQGGFDLALMVGVSYVVINMFWGNVVEPKVMGKRLGLSELVVITSLIFWNWVLGPVGMVLSVPLTMVVKIMLEHDEGSRFIAVLLGPSQPPEDPDTT